MHLINAIIECEEFLKNTYTSPRKFRDRIQKWIYLKPFGNLEHIKSQLLIKYPHSEEVFLIGQDRNKIQTFWIPC